MILHSLTATFGKLSHQTLELKPGLNIIHAPNEWGKSTWCAFLIAMLYGIDTQQRSTKSALADKERYLPWSQEPMSGRMELTWNGQRITIERSTSGRIPMGNFRAYETETGIAVPELTAANCGKVLLGVEKEVFTRAGFIRLQDMPVTPNDALRRRLNNLVTTGDESGAGELLAKQLKDLKNKCQHNRTGLLPEAEAERAKLQQQLRQQQELQLQQEQLIRQQADLENQLLLLENHACALRYEAAKDSAQKLQLAREQYDRAQQELEQLEKDCAALPSPEQAEAARQKGQLLIQRQNALTQKQQALPNAPTQPAVPELFDGLTPADAIARTKQDYAALKELERSKKKQAALPFVYGAVALIALVIAIVFIQSSLAIAIAGGVVALTGIVLAVVCILSAGKRQKKIEALYRQYPGIAPDGWVSFAQQYEQEQLRYQLALAEFQSHNGDVEKELSALQEEVEDYAPGGEIHQALRRWEEILQQHQELNLKKRAFQNIAQHIQALQEISPDAPAPTQPDTLTYSQQETQRLLEENKFNLQKLHLQLGQCMGQAQTLGQEDELKAQINNLSRRINRLEEYYRALELAQEVLSRATATLQKRFAPRISKQAQEYFCRLTGGRYQSIQLDVDLSLHATAENENVSHSSLYYSDGTVDQLYLALRLAVSAELTPEAPLVLDDALLRFDDTRAQVALSLLSEISQQKQILLFSCQGREEQLAKNL